MASILETVRPPVPDLRPDPRPDLESAPKTADAMADEGDREGPVLNDGSRPDEIETERDPQFARNGE